MAVLQNICRYLDDSKISRAIRGFNSSLSNLGERIDRLKETAIPAGSHPAAILVQIPHCFILHHWVLLSPTSDFWLVEVFLFIFRYAGKLINLYEHY